MHLISSDILADLTTLSLGLLLLLLPVGLMLWLFGWWSHRFWIVLATTVAAGVFGLSEANAWRAQPIVVALLLAIAAGVLALALVRGIAFVWGGAIGVFFVQWIFASLNQPVIVFLICGLVSLLLFRWCFMLLTSVLGSIGLIYACLALLHYHHVFDVVRWSEENNVLLNSIGGGLTFMGFLFQFFQNRWQIQRLKNEEGDDGSVIAGLLSFVGAKKKSKRKAA